MKASKIPLFKVFMSPNVDIPLRRVLHSGYIGQGKIVDEFEKKLSQFIGNPFVMTVNSGTSALQLSLRLAGITPGDDVISTPMTCTATNWPILAAGANIVWADINPRTGNMDPDSVKQKLTKKTKAVLCVDWGGYPCDIDAIRKAAGGIPVIEDAAHAFGSRYKGKMVGQSADFTCFSFQAIKHLTTVDGGALAVRTKKDFDRGILLRWYGIDRNRRSQENRIEIDVGEWGYKFHMNDISATIGLENLKYSRKILNTHRENADFFRKTLSDIDSIRLTEELTGYESSYWLFTLLVKNRPSFLEYMSARKIMVSQVHRRNDTHPVVKNYKTRLPGVDEFSKHMVCIPVGWWVSKKDRAYIADVIKKYIPSKTVLKDTDIYCYC
jgi:perosamine synthetase